MRDEEINEGDHPEGWSPEPEQSTTNERSPELEAAALEVDPDILLTEVEREELADGVLSQAEVEEVRKSSRVKAQLLGIAQMARGAYRDLRESLYDRKFKGLVRRQQFEHYKNAYGPLKKAILEMSREQLDRHPEIVRTLEESYIEELSRLTTGYPSTDLTESVRSMRVIEELLGRFPDVVDSIFRSEKAKEVSEKVFINYLLTPGQQHTARRVGEVLHIDFPRMQALVRNQINYQGHLVYPAGRDIYDLSTALKDFELGGEAINFAKDYFLRLLKLRDEWGLLESAMRVFELQDRDDLIRALLADRDELKRSLLQGVMARLIKVGNLHDAQRYLGHYQEIFGLEVATTEDLAGLPGFPEALKQGFYNRVESGYDLAAEYKAALEFGFNLEEAKVDSDFKKALGFGLKAIIRNGAKEEELNVLSLLGSDIQSFLSSPEAIPSLQDYLQTKKTLDYEFLYRLNIPAESVRVLERKLIHHFVKLKSFKDVVKILRDNDFSLEEQTEISVSVFGSDVLVKYIQSLSRLVKEENIPEAMLEAMLSQPERFKEKNFDVLMIYSRLSKIIDQSPSQEIVKIKDQLIAQILDADDPQSAYEKINKVFVENNVPLVGKILKIFMVLYNPKVLNEKISAASSPVLQRAKTRRRYDIVYRDLLKVHVESGNPSLFNYLSLINEAGDLFSRIELGENMLSPAEQKKLRYVFSKLKTLIDSSKLGIRKQYPVMQDKSLEEMFEQLKAELEVEGDQTVSERVVEMFLKPLGYENISDVLETMQRVKRDADRRNKELARNMGQNFRLEPDALLKGIDAEYLRNILQNGSVAKEFLGASATSDATPFDTDLSIIPESDRGKSFSEICGGSAAYGYGPGVLFAIRDRGQFQKTSTSEIDNAKYEKDKYELFRSGVTGESHYGIRTGIPSTEIDFMIVKPQLLGDRRDFRNLLFTIVENGFYIPVVDGEGKLVFTQEQYEEYRRYFAGLERFDGPNLEFSSSRNESYYPDIRRISEDKDKDVERLSKVKEGIKSIVLQALSESGVSLREQYDEGIVGSELLDIGSTGRGTSAVGEGDFDFNLRMDDSEFNKISNIAARIIELLGETTGEVPMVPTEGNRYQLRVFKSTIFGEPIDVDIGFSKKSDLEVYASHDAINDKLEFIRKYEGQEAYNETIANILLAKAWLKEGHAYKKGDRGDGGLGGIGVENLILLYGGNIKDAFAAFYQASVNPDGTRKRLDQLKEDFPLLDPGINLRYNNHDNFIYNMNNEGYNRMLDVIEQRFPELVV